MFDELLDDQFSQAPEPDKRSLIVRGLFIFLFTTYIGCYVFMDVISGIAKTLFGKLIGAGFILLIFLLLGSVFVLFRYLFSLNTGKETIMYRSKLGVGVLIVRASFVLCVLFLMTLFADKFGLL